MNNLKVKLLFHTPLEIMIKATRTSYHSLNRMDTTGDNLGTNDKSLIYTIIKHGHTSVLEHINYTFEIEGLPRGILLELERHRIGVSLTVESTRWTLKKLLKDKEQCEKKFEWLKSFLPEKYINENWITSYCDFLIDLIENQPNDIAKLFLLESYPTTFVMTINARALRHMFELRLPKNAHFIFRQLMEQIKEVLPESHYILYIDVFNDVNYIKGGN